MKINNKYVNIKIGNQQVKKHNFFLNSYLSYFSKGQRDTSYINYNYNRLKDLSANLYIKLDTPLTGITTSSTLNESDFDMRLYRGNKNLIGNKNNITVIYTFSNSISFDLYESDWVEYTDRSILNDRKITAISFNLETFLDVSDYNLYFHDSEIITISREDFIITDAICDGYDYPYHLSPILKDETYGTICAYVYSVGLGYNIGRMEEEYVIGDDVELINEDDYTFSFVIKKASDNGIYPGGNIYPSSNLYSRTFKIKSSIYPRPTLYLSGNLYPRAGDYKYIIMKYKFYYINRGGDVIETGNEYTMSFYTPKEGILTIKDKIERNDN